MSGYDAFVSPAICYFPVAPRAAIIFLADAAFNPSGLSAKYFSRASIVPGASVTLPSASVVAFPASAIPS